MPQLQTLSLGIQRHACGTFAIPFKLLLAFAFLQTRFMMIPDNQGTYRYGTWLGQQQQYFPQFDLGFNLGGGMFTRITDYGRIRADPYVAAPSGASSQNAWHLPRHFWEPWTTVVSQQEDKFYQTIGPHTAVVTSQRQVINSPPTPPSSSYSDMSYSQEALPGMTICHPPNNVTSDQSVFIEGLLADTTLQEATQIQPSCSTFKLNGTKYYRCACGHLAQRKGDMRRHHESSKHAFRQHFCVICGSGFTRKDGLKRHKKKKHPQHKTAGSAAQTS